MLALVFVMLLATANGFRIILPNLDDPNTEASFWNVRPPHYNQINVTCHLALRPRNPHLLEKTVNEISNPSSPRYGQYLTQLEIDRIVATSLPDYHRVTLWLDQVQETTGYNFTDIQWYSDSIKLTAKVPLIERMFNVSMNRWVKFRNGPFRAFTTDNYTLPESLNGSVVMVVGLAEPRDGQPSLDRRVTSLDSNQSGTPDSGMVTREVLQRLYQFPSAPLSKNTSVGAMEYQGTCGFSNEDLVYSQKANGLVANPVPKNQTLGIKNNYPDTESQLDIQMIGTVASGANLWYEDYGGWMYGWAVDFYNRPQIPDIVSLSWGWNEDDQCSIANCTKENSQVYVNRCNYEFMKLAARGVTIVVASGDAGSPGRTNENCDSTESGHINPVFPGSSKWVTSVGATYLVNGTTQWWTGTPVCKQVSCANGTLEYGVSHQSIGWTSGSGFDHWEQTPAWQYKHVLSYLNSGVTLPDQKYFNAYGRAYPDVAAIGHNCAVRSGGFWSPVDGTSCSAPIMAGILAILNDHQVAHGRPKLGFANPLLYEMAENQPGAYNGVPVGNSTCTEYTCCGPQFGFVSHEGWDPISGLGTPSVQSMIEYLDKKFT